MARDKGKEEGCYPQRFSKPGPWTTHIRISRSAGQNADSWWWWWGQQSRVEPVLQVILCPLKVENR